MAYTMATIAALLLACTPATLASPRDRMSPVLNGADLDDRPQYGGMGHRPREHHPVIHPEFPANRVKRHEFGLHKRQTTESNEDYDLVASQSWYWGSDTRAVAPGADSNPLMNLTGYAEDAHQRYLSQERFGDLISSIECLNGSIAFKFGSQDTFASIRDEWDWINTGNRIVFITLEAGTCSNTKRQPYLATHVAYDAGSRKATFKAATRTWEDVLPNYNVVLDTQGVLPQGDAALQHRFEGDASIDLNHDFSGNIATLQDVANTSLQFDLECKSCATSGRLDLHVEGSFIPFKISASLKPTGVGANIELGFKLGGELTSELKANPQLPAIALPGGGTFGPVVVGPNLVVSYLAQLSSVSGEADLDIGTKITIDDSAIAQVGVAGSDNSFSGWTPKFEQIGPELSASVSVSAQTGPEISVEVDLTVIGFGGTAGLLLAAPQLTASLSANADTAGGVCGNPSADLGASFDVGVLAEFDGFGGIKSNDDKHPNKFVLLSTSTALFSTCLTIGGGIPSSTAAAASTTAAEALTSATATPAADGQFTRFPTCGTDCSSGGCLGPNEWQSNVCIQAGLDADFNAVSFNSPTLDAGNGCVVTYFSGTDSFNPASDFCMDLNAIGSGDTKIESMIVAC